MSKSATKDNNQFALGLIMGFLAGSTGYFLFTTEQGKELKENLKDKWQEIKNNLPVVDELTFGDLKFSELVNIILGSEIPSSVTQRGPIIKEASRRTARSQNKTPIKFKGLYSVFINLQSINLHLCQKTRLHLNQINKEIFSHFYLC